MSEWFDIPVLATRPAAAGLTEVDLDVRGSPLFGAHRRPGQFIRVSLEGLGESPFAIASSPAEDAATLELLVKQGTPLSDALVQLRRGDRVRVSRVEGEGFPVDAARGRDVLLFATGSGISALRSLLGELLRDRAGHGRATLYFGVRTPDGFAYASELDHWRREGITVHQTVSQPGDSGWEGLTGYVQEHIPEGNLSRAVAFLCGHDEMVRDVTRLLVERGVPQDRIFLNY